MARILVVDDEPQIRALLGELLETSGFEPILAEDGVAAIATFKAERPPVVLLDLKMPKLGGMEVLPELRAIDPRVSVIILTASNEIRTAVQAMRLGAYDYLTKPAQFDEVVLTIERALERHRLLAEVEQLKIRVRQGSSLARQMGPSAEVQRIVEQVDQVADSNFTVLVQGETGTGKELVARAVHEGSPRRDRPFIAIDCGAIPETLIESEIFGYEKGAFTGADRRKEGHFQLAAGGTLFLDEIVNLPLPTQAKLLRALQERQIRPLGGTASVAIDVRIIAASNVSLDAATSARGFRQDLYYRLAEFTIVLPPLRERRADIPYLAKRFAEEAAMDLKRPVHGLSEAATDLLVRHSWPGNVRELRNVVRQAVLKSGGVILPAHLSVAGGGAAAEARSARPAGAPGTLSLSELARLAAGEAEQQAIREALRASGGNKSQAARALRTDFKTLHLRMKEYGISSRDFEAP
jgi:two-component system nitrogen regulation response regulator GlnG